MAGDLAICYVADRNFLLGTFISIKSLQRFMCSINSEIYLFTVGLDAEDFKKVAEFGRSISVKVLEVNLAEQVRSEKTRWNKTHVPLTALGRFFFEPYLDKNIKRILYIDGDIIFVTDPGRLLNFIPPADMMAAAEDISYFSQGDWGRHGRKIRSYFAGLRIDGRNGYFNSGLLMAERKAWSTIMVEAAQFFINNSDKCLYHDQSALNAVLGQRRIRLSPAWNFQTPFRYWGLENQIKPVIYHFTEFPKPWMGPARPWTDIQDTLCELASTLPELGLPRNELTNAELSRYTRQNQGRERRLWTVYLWRLFRRRQRVRRLAKIATL